MRSTKSGYILLAALGAASMAAVACASGAPGASGSGEELSPGTSGSFDAGVPRTLVPSTDDDAGAAATTTAVDSGTGATAVDSGAPDTAPPVDAGPPRCDPTNEWASMGRVPSIPAAGFTRFSGMSATELTAAWTSASGAVYVADRAARSSAFGNAAAVDTGSAPIAVDRAALGPTGNMLLVVSADRTTFSGFTRAGAGAPWMATVATAFAGIRGMTADGGGRLSEPALGSNGASLFFVLTPPTAPPSLFESTWDPMNHAWSTGVELQNPELASTDSTHRRRPTSASSDGRTLFFFDEVAGIERGAWRDSPTSAFTLFADATGMNEAAPSYQCDTLYFQGTDTSGSGVFIAQ